MAHGVEITAETLHRMHIQEDGERDADEVAGLRSCKPVSDHVRGKIKGKSKEESALLRQQGNAAYARQDLPEALRKYTRSIATAPCDGDTTDLALAFANRSAVHFSLGNYEDCLNDIEQAFKVNYPSRLRYKVLKRRAECHRAMGNMKAAMWNFKEAIACCLEEDKKRSMEQELAALKPPEQVYKPRLRVRPPPEKYLGDNPMIPGASACIKIKINKKYGRHLVATQDIPPGEVLAVEDPLGCDMHPDKCDVYCFRCMRRCSAMIPCKSCTSVMYCSETCRESSWTESHDLECAILVKMIAADMPKKLRIVLRLFIVALKKHGSLQQLYDYATQLDSEGSNVCDAEGRFDPTDLRVVYNLQQCKMPSVVREVNARRCAFLVSCIDENSQLFHGSEELKKFTGGLLMRFVRIVTISVIQMHYWVLDDSSAFGCAIYATGSLLNHQCIANAELYHLGKTMVMFTVRPIDKGEQVFISYVGNNCATQEVQTKIDANMEYTFGFKCDCRGCTNHLEGLNCLPLCPRCRKVVNTTPKQVVKCPHCYECFNASAILSEAKCLFVHFFGNYLEPALNPANIPHIIEVVTKLHRTVVTSNWAWDIIQTHLRRLLLIVYNPE